MAIKDSKLRLPRIDKITLHRFSLFTSRPDEEIECGDGVLGLVGANGIGKSTLLSAINFGLTGIVSDPDRRFESIEEYYEHSMRFSERYFSGRISERDREAAEIVLDFRVGDFHYQINRGLFSSEELRSLKISRISDSETVIAITDKTRRELHQTYTEKLAEHVGLSTFEQFVFLQHFVFTFDERRKTLFWDQKILELVLYLTFGVDPGDAKRVDSLKREFESADSRVRNHSYQATETRRKINEVQRNFKSTAEAQESFDVLAAKHEKLVKRLEEESGELAKIENRLKDINLNLADQSARESALRDEYTHFFDRRLKKLPHISQHPLLVTSIADAHCGLCGNDGAGIVPSITEKLESKKCPICDSALSVQQRSENDTNRIREIDKEISKSKETIRDLLKGIERIRKEEGTAKDTIRKLEIELDAFERANNLALASLKKALTDKGGVDNLIAAYKTQLADLLKLKDEFLRKRTVLKDQLVKIQRDIQKEYSAAEKDFVPLFNELAHLFLGMDLEVRMNASDASGLNLIVEVKGTARRQQHNLSESQRFFLDIALRMAITQFLSDKTSQGTLYVDTPEGSLDIAYEKRAGDMLAKFVSKGHRIVMTANLNSSKLLLSLARNCKRTKMTVCRMTEWAELSGVQIEEEDLFDEAYEEIEAELGN